MSNKSKRNRARLPQPPYCVGGCGRRIEDGPDDDNWYAVTGTSSQILLCCPNCDDARRAIERHCGDSGPTLAVMHIVDIAPN
jgi:hypothetical protein